MPIEITGRDPSDHQLQPGDVIMVHRKLRDKQTREPFTWKFFAVVTKIPRSNFVFQYVILDEHDRKPTWIYVTDYAGTDFHIWYLDPDEWPDGVHVFRTKMILEGRLDEVV